MDLLIVLREVGLVATYGAHYNLSYMCIYGDAAAKRLTLSSLREIICRSLSKVVDSGAFNRIFSSYLIYT